MGTRAALGPPATVAWTVTNQIYHPREANRTRPPTRQMSDATGMDVLDDAWNAASKLRNAIAKRVAVPYCSYRYIRNCYRERSPSESYLAPEREQWRLVRECAVEPW